MSDLQSIENVLRRAAQRRRWERAWHGFWNAFFGGVMLWLIVLVVYKLAPIPRVALSVAAVAGGIAALTGFVAGWMRKPTLRQTARYLDKHQQLQERISTALEVSAEGRSEGWRALLVSDAARFAAKLDPRKVFPFQLPRISRWSLAALALAAGLGFVPEYRSKDYLDKKAQAAAIQDIGRRLVEITHQSLEHRPPALEQTRRAMESVQEVGLRMDKNVLTQNDALKDLANVADKLKAQLQDLGKKNPTYKSVEREAHERPGSETPGGAAQKQMDDLQKALGKAGENPAALDKLGDQMQNLQKAMAGMPKNNSPEAAAERQKMAEKLAELAQQAKALGEPMPNLDEAIDALKNGRTDDFQKDMDLATTDLEKVQQMAKTLQQMQQQADKQGKDLPEQLKFAQTDLAGQSLQKMIDDLKSGKMSQAQMSKLLDEVTRSIDPAAPYGEAAQNLQQAASQLHSGDKAGAAQSLAAAARELEKTQAEMADAKAVQGSLDAVNYAETALATHRQWGECPICGDRSGRCLAAGHCLGLGKGVGGGGVGTWTDDDSQLHPKMSSLWDNSGINRGDTKGRGLTDRGDPQLADNLAPTRLHGQISPGTPMPSITLKGVSIKGQSSVGYQEAVTAAQSDAQSALNQDQVPRAYQGAVRDYFDDLKK